MTIDAILLLDLTQTCDIHRKTIVTGPELGNKSRTFSTTPSTAGVACLLRPERARGETAQVRNLHGDTFDDLQVLIVADTVDIVEDDQVVLKTFPDGTALTTAQKIRNTFVVENVQSGRTNLGHLQAVLSPARKITKAVGL